MKLFWATSRRGNIGDDLNPLLWGRLFGRQFFDDSPDEVFVGVGSILSTMWTFEGDTRKIVFGSGARSHWSLPAIDHTWDLRFVRGPKTANLLRRWNVGFITDPAVMLPTVLEPNERDSSEKAANLIGFVPHHGTPRRFVDKVVQSLGLIEISPHLKAREFVNALCACDYIVAEAMHGAILADAYRIPWIGVRIINELFEGFTTRFKWEDWLGSLGLGKDSVVQAAPGAFRFARKGSAKIVFKVIGSGDIFDRFTERAISILNRSLNEQRWNLSKEGILAGKRENIAQEIAKLKLDYGR